MCAIIILHMCTKTHYHMSYGSWNMEWETRIFSSFWAIFFALLLPPPLHNHLENQNFEQTKKASRDVILLHTCAKNHDHIIYASWDKKCNRHNFLSFCAIFAILPHYWPQKLKFGKNVKKPWDIILLNMLTINEDHMMYDSWDIRYEGQSFLSIWAIYCPFTVLTTSKFWKKFKKTCRDIIILHLCTTNENHMMKSGVRQTEFFVIMDYFLPFYLAPPDLPTNNPKNQNFDKMKKITGDIFILHMCVLYMKII